MPINLSTYQPILIKSIVFIIHRNFSQKEIGNLKFLEMLDVSENRIEWIADEVGNADSLTDLHATTNLLVEIPENLCEYKQRLE